MPQSAGSLLREVRLRHGLTQAQLAARARTSQAAISRIERDQDSPSVAMLQRLLDLMGEDLVLSAEQIDYTLDKTLFDVTLAMTASERLQHGTDLVNFVLRIVAAPGRARKSVPAATLHDPAGAPPYAELVRGAGPPELVEGHAIRVACASSRTSCARRLSPMGRGSRPKVRWKNERQRKKKAREARKSPPPPPSGRR